jgi:starch phosphorylase
MSIKEVATEMVQAKKNVRKAKKNNQQISASEFKARVQHHLKYTLGDSDASTNKHAWWQATCLAVNESIFDKLQASKSAIVV